MKEKKQIASGIIIEIIIIYLATIKMLIRILKPIPCAHIWWVRNVPIPAKLQATKINQEQVYNQNRLMSIK